MQSVSIYMKQNLLNQRAKSQRVSHNYNGMWKRKFITFTNIKLLQLIIFFHLIRFTKHCERVGATHRRRNLQRSCFEYTYLTY